MDQVTINLNQCVKVKLTPFGYYRLAELHNDYLGRIPNWERREWKDYEMEADKEGYTRFSMWDFMHKFGEVSTPGGSVYFDINIVLEGEF